MKKIILLISFSLLLGISCKNGNSPSEEIVNSDSLEIYMDYDSLFKVEYPVGFEKGPEANIPGLLVPFEYKTDRGDIYLVCYVEENKKGWDSETAADSLLFDKREQLRYEITDKDMHSDYFILHGECGGLMSGYNVFSKSIVEDDYIYSLGIAYPSSVEDNVGGLMELVKEWSPKIIKE